MKNSNAKRQLICEVLKPLAYSESLEVLCSLLNKYQSIDEISAKSDKCLEVVSADKILAVDGCPLNCVKNSLEEAGFDRFDHLQLADLGLEKCSSPVTEENVDKVVAKGKEMIA